MCLTPDAARKFVEGVRRAAKYCQAWVEAGGRGELIRGETRGALVKSWDGKVNVRFDTITDRESIPYESARLLAEEVRAKITEAEHCTTINWHPRGLLL